MKHFSLRNISWIAAISLAFPGCTSQNGKQTEIRHDNQSPEKHDTSPSIIIIFTDDMGYGDLGCYGSTIHKTPNIDKIAEQGIRFTDFYVAAPVCTPSRASLMTGCYPQRVDMHVNEKSEDEFRAVLTPESPKGINPDETTIAEILQQQNYETACIGKWHLGDQKPFYPTNHGFDYFYGILHSHNQSTETCPLAIFEQDSLVETPVDIPLLTKKMTAKAIEFIQSNKDHPFFLYLPHPMPHFPLAASNDFKGKSRDGIYGDAIEELDWSVGEIMKTLNDLDIYDNTIVVFTSDNGGEARGGMVKGGLNHPLRGHKGTVWEGGMRVPCLIQWPAKIPQNKVYNQLITAMDFLPTFSAIAGADIRENKPIDGKNIFGILTNPENAKSPYNVFFYYDRDQLQAVRWKNWKLHLPQEDGRYPAAWKSNTIPFDKPELYNLHTDLTETWNVADSFPQVVDSMMQMTKQTRNELGDRKIPGKAVREAGFVDTARCPVEWISKNQDI